MDDIVFVIFKVREWLWWNKQDWTLENVTNVVDNTRCYVGVYSTKQNVLSNVRRFVPEEHKDMSLAEIIYALGAKKEQEWKRN